VAIRWQSLRPDIFAIETDDSPPVLYAPLQGVAMQVNQAYIRHFRAALDGDAVAMQLMGLSGEVLDSFVRPPQSLAWRLDPEWPRKFEPTGATVFLTHKCTMRCAYCYCHGGEGRDMPWPVFERAVRFVADNARRLGQTMKLNFHGGDPGACWGLFQKSVAFAERISAEAGIPLEMTIGTNGLYSDDQARYIADHVRDATLSIDGTSRVHDRCRRTVNGQPTLERVLQTARIFDEKGLSYFARMTVTGEDVAVLPESVDHICRNTQVKALRAEPLYSRGRAVTHGLHSPDPAAFVDAFRKALKVAQSHGRDLSYSGARVTGVQCAFCAYPEPTFGVTPEGNLTCCYEILHPEDPLRDPFFYGRIPEDGSAIQVDEERVATIRSWARTHRAACAGCFCVNTCAGDCAAKAMDGHRAGPESPARCEISRALVYDMILAVLSGGKPTPDIRSGVVS
jgi:uncharacterized protein